MSSATNVDEKLSLCDFIVPVSYTRLLLIYDYVIHDLEKPLLKFLYNYCPSAFKRISDNKLIDSTDHPTIYTHAIDRNTSLSSLDIEHTDIFPYGRIPDKESPLFFLHQLTLKDGTILAIGIHHRLTDGHGFINLIYRFSVWMSGEQIPLLFEHNRSLIKKKTAPTILYQHREYYSEDSLLLPSIYCPHVETDVIVRHYKKQDLFNMLNITSKHVSFNDVLVAWLTKIISSVRHVPSKTIVKVGMPTNGRNILGLDENYFGNCVFYIYIPFLMTDLESSSVDELSERVHEERKKCMTKAYIESALAYIKCNTTKSHSSIYPIFNRFGEYDIAFSNWSRFPMYQIDFGHGPPKRVFLPPGKRRNGMINILPSIDGDNEVELYIRLNQIHVKELLKILK
ncbi:unnamed protein product [Adineta steineri]|uniref:Uncharacterized protein n=1 Tax=Adineta steineri TaxID=433720 RepID=A0A814X2T5_9BILA|nr:unnamed protein product [Adineta steineri]CAF1210502.1 unnamed protein product [Adineta steineri]CAF1379617.1 unnamed protein product [Adineta steineri]CAF1607081.1 unnamed protein product [Adineta steineri]